MPVNFFDLTKQNQSLQKELEAKIAEVVAQGEAYQRYGETEPFDVAAAWERSQ